MVKNDCAEEWQLRGIKKHFIQLYPLIKATRREKLEDTLDHLSSEESNVSFFPRTTGLYKSEIQILEKLLSEIEQDSNFTSSCILHSSSDLGLTHKLKTEHRSGAILFFDGLYIRVSRIITTEPVNLENLLSKTGYPSYENEVTKDFISCAQNALPNSPPMGSWFYNYYTIDEANWEKLGLRREGNAQIRLILTDPNIFTVTALIFVETGKDFSVYLGEEDRIHQMIAHDYFLIQEINDFFNFYDMKSKEVIFYQNKLNTDFGGVISPIWQIHAKIKAWNSVKVALKSLYSIEDLTGKGKLLVRALEILIERKLAFFNGPRQIWRAGEEQDTEEKIQHSTNHFFNVKLDESELKKNSNLPSPSDPFYKDDVVQLNKKVSYVSTLTDEIYQREKDLLTALQTEFALYAVWFALIAILIAIVTLALNLFS